MNWNAVKWHVFDCFYTQPLKSRKRLTSSLVIVFGGRILTVASEGFLNPLPKCPRCVISFAARCLAREYKTSGGVCLASSLFTHCLYALVERGIDSSGESLDQDLQVMLRVWGFCSTFSNAYTPTPVPPMGSHGEKSLWNLQMVSKCLTGSNFSLCHQTSVYFEAPFKSWQIDCGMSFGEIILFRLCFLSFLLTLLLSFPEENVRMLLHICSPQLFLSLA